MNVIEIDGTDYNLPSNWSEISLRKYNKIIKLEQDLKNYKSNIQYNIDLFSLLLDLEIDIIEQLSITDFNQLRELCSWINEVPDSELLTHITINDITYAFPRDLNNLTMGETISLETIIGDDMSLEKILAILLRPAKLIKNTESGIEEWIPEKFDTTNYEYRQELFLDNLMITDVMKFNSFFLNGGKLSSTNTKASSVKGSLLKIKKKTVDLD